MYLITDDKFGLADALKDCSWITVLNSKNEEGKTLPFKELAKHIPKNYVHDVVLFNYGKIVKEDEAKGLFMYNIHPSPLPLYKGPDPIGAQLLAGVNDTAVTLQKLSFIGIDDGELCMAYPYSLQHNIKANVRKAIVALITIYFNEERSPFHTTKYDKQLENLNTCTSDTLNNRLRYLAWHEKKPYVKLKNKACKLVKIHLKVGTNVNYFSIFKEDNSDTSVKIVEDNYLIKLVVDNKFAVCVNAIKFAGKNWLKGIDAINGLNGQGLITVIKQEF